MSSPTVSTTDGDHSQLEPEDREAQEDKQRYTQPFRPGKRRRWAVVTKHEKTRKSCTYSCLPVARGGDKGLSAQRRGKTPSDLTLAIYHWTPEPVLPSHLAEGEEGWCRASRVSRSTSFRPAL